MANLNLGDQLHPGQTYTFRFAPRGFNPFVTGIDITQDLQAIDYLSGVSAQGSAGLVDVYVQFAYEGDGTDTVDYVASDIMTAVANAHTLYTLEFQNATIGTQTQAQGALASLGASAAGGAASALTPSTTTLVLIVAGLVLVVFLVSGGPSIARSLAE